MANELRHSDVGTALSKSEWEATGGHIFNSQAAGDIMYASTTSQLTRLGIGTANQVLATNSGATAPEWVTSVASATLAATVTVVDSTDTSSYIAMFDSATGSLAAKTDAGITYNAGTGMLTATGFTGPLTGTLQTAAQGNITSVGTLTDLTVSGSSTTIGTVTSGIWQGTAIASTYIAADAITGAKIADDAIDSEHYTDGSIDTAHLAADVITGAKIADDAIDSEHYTDGSIDTAHLAADAVTGAKIADDAIDSEHYTDGSIDNAHIADDAIDSEHYAAGSIDTAHLGDDQVTYAKIQNVSATDRILGRDSSGAGVIEEITPANLLTMLGIETAATADQTAGEILTLLEDGIDSVHYKDGSIDNAHIADDAIDSEHYADGSIENAHLADNSVDSDNYVDGSIDNIHLADNSVDSDNYVDGSIDNAHIADDAIDSEHYAAASIDFAHIQNVAANSILGRNANSSGVLSEVALATTQILIGDGTGFTAAALSSDVTMTNAGAVTIADDAVSLAKMAGLARGKIIYGDSSGDPAALAVGTADQVLTHDGTDISWEDAGGGGGTITLVADGTIDTGAPVYLTSAGKAKQVKGAWDYPRGAVAPKNRYHGSGVTQGFKLHWDDNAGKLVTPSHWGGYNHNPMSLEVVDTTNHYTGVINAKGPAGDTTYGQTVTALGYYTCSAYDEDTDRLVIGGVYTGDATSRAFVSGLSGTTWTMGSISLSAGTGYYQAMAYDKTADKIILVFTGGDQDGFAVVGTVTGGATNSIAWGTAVEYAAGNCSAHHIVYATNIGKCVATYLDVDDNYNYKSVNISVTGTTPSFGALQTIKSNLCKAGQADNNMICYDENAEKIVVFFTYNSATTSSGGSGHVLSDWGHDKFTAAVAIGTPSTDTTAWNVADLYTGSSDSMGHASAGARRPGSYYGLDSTTNGADTAMEFFAGSGYMTCCYIPDAEKVLLIWATSANEFALPASVYKGSPRHLYMMLGTISGTSISFTSPELLWQVSVCAGLSVGYDQDNDRAILVMKEDKSDEVTVIPGAWESGVVEDFNVGHLDQYLGLATTGVSDTENVTITVPGGVNEDQSSLVIGSTYFLAPTGEIHNKIGRLWEGHRVTVGQAISATKILVGSAGYTSPDFTSND